MRYLIVFFIMLCKVLVYSECYAVNNNSNHFMQNVGQLQYTDGSKCSDIKYYVVGALSSYITSHGVMYKINQTTKDDPDYMQNASSPDSPAINSLRYDVNFVNINHFDLTSNLESETHVNFYKGNDFFQSQSYDVITLGGNNGAIKVDYYIKQNKLKYDITLKSNFNINDIALQYNGIDRLMVDNQGNLQVITKLGMVTEGKPYAYQLINGKQIEVGCKYVVEGNILKFETEDYNKNFDLIIDPTVAWITYLGGSMDDYLYETSIDNNQNIITDGYVRSTDMPVTPGLITKQSGDADVYVAKFDKNHKFLWGTYIGGNGQEFSYSCNITKKNQIWISGDTYSNNFPTTDDAIQKSIAGNADAYVVKLDENGHIIYSTLHGGNSYDSYTTSRLDKNDNLWLVGRTISTNLYITSDAFQKKLGGFQDCFIVKYNDVDQMVYSTYYGGNMDDMPDGFDIDDDGNLAINGQTISDNFPLAGYSFQASRKSGNEAWVAKVSSTGQLIWATYFGGNGFDLGDNIIADHNGNVIVDGYTSSTDLPTTPGCFQKNKSSGLDCYLAKFDKDGHLIWCTYFGGNGDEGKQVTYAQWGGMDVGANNQILISLETNSSDLPTSSASFQRTYGGNTDVFIAEFQPDGQLQYGTYLGGSARDVPFNVKYQPNTYTVVSTGFTSSSDFPVTSDAYQKNIAGGVDGYITIFGTCNAQSKAYFNFHGVVKMPDYHHATFKLMMNIENLDDFEGKSTFTITFRYNKTMIDTIKFSPGKVVDQVEDGDYELIKVEFPVSSLVQGNQLLTDIYVHSVPSLDNNATRLQIVSSSINLPCVIEQYDAIDINFYCDPVKIKVASGNIESSPIEDKFELPLFIVNPPAGIDFTKESLTFSVQYERENYRFQNAEGMQVIDNSSVGTTGILTLSSTPYLQNDTLFIGKLIGNLLDNYAASTTFKFYDAYFDNVCLSMDNFDIIAYNKTLCIRFEHGVILFDPNTIEITPDPVVNIMNVKIHSESGNASKFQIFDSYGNQIYETDLSTGNIDGEELSISSGNLPSGLYFAVLENGKGRVTKKFIVLK